MLLKWNFYLLSFFKFRIIFHQSFSLRLICLQYRYSICELTDLLCNCTSSNIYFPFVNCEITKKLYLYLYSVFKKEGGKVKGYYTIKKLILGAVKGFIVTVKMGNLINCIKLPKNFTLKLKIRSSNIQRKMAKNTLLSPKFAIFLFWGLILNYLEMKKEI